MIKYDGKQQAKIMQERIKHAIQSRGYSYADVAHYTGISLASVSRYANGERTPDARGISLICSFLGVSSDWLLGVTDNMTVSGQTDEVANLYAMATPDDRAVVDTVLKKYKK